MSWTCIASFVCSTLAIAYSLHVARMDLFKQVEQAPELSGAFFGLFKQSLQRTVLKNRAWSVVAAAICFWLLYRGDYGLFGAFSVGLVAPCVVGTFGSAIDEAAQRLQGADDYRDLLCRARFVRALMVMGCGLLGSAAILHIGSSGILSSAGTDPGLLDLFACGAYGGAALFWRACPAEASSPPCRPVASDRPTSASQSGRDRGATSTGWGAASWDAFLYGSYTVVFVVAAVSARGLCGTTSHAVETPLLIGTVGLLACLFSAWFAGVSYMNRIHHSPAMQWFVPGGPLVLACAALVLLRDQLQVVLLPGAVYRETGTNLLPAALAGMFLTGLMLVISEMGEPRYAERSHRETEILMADRATMVRRAIMATFMTLAPFFLALLCLVSGYYVVDKVDRHHAAGLLGMAMAGVGLISISGVAGAPGSKKMNMTLRKLYHTGTLALLGLGLYVQYAVAIAALERKNLAFDLSNPKIVLGLLIGGLIPYMIVALFAVASVKFFRSLAREIALRYRTRQ